MFCIYWDTSYKKANNNKHWLLFACEMQNNDQYSQKCVWQLRTACQNYSVPRRTIYEWDISGFHHSHYPEHQTNVRFTLPTYKMVGSSSTTGQNKICLGLLAPDIYCYGIYICVLRALRETWWSREDTNTGLNLVQRRSNICDVGQGWANARPMCYKRASSRLHCVLGCHGHCPVYGRNYVLCERKNSH